ncbi:hypothetical protein [Paraburkholderia aromaticivorans]|uniref:hypothetical protein n=1 Tax=Paraburkholderia aromaticivorans TaxID=2026199 RepID=UPI0012FD6A8E|nr:hypothetical protein [Paraburkholderia aromaticivorans]
MGAIHIDSTHKPIPHAAELQLITEALPGYCAMPGNGVGERGGCAVRNPKCNFNDQSRLLRLNASRLGLPSRFDRVEKAAGVAEAVVDRGASASPFISARWFLFFCPVPVVVRTVWMYSAGRGPTTAKWFLEWEPEAEAPWRKMCARKMSTFLPAARPNLANPRACRSKAIVQIRMVEWPESIRAQASPHNERRFIYMPALSGQKPHA